MNWFRKVRGAPRSVHLQPKQSPLNAVAVADFALAQPILLHESAAARTFNTKIGQLEHVEVKFVPTQKDPTTWPSIRRQVESRNAWSGATFLKLHSDDEHDCERVALRFEFTSVPRRERDRVESYEALSRLAHEVNEWLGLLESWLSVLQFRGDREIRSLYQQVDAEVAFPDGTTARVVPRGPMVVSGFNMGESLDHALSEADAEVALSHAAHGTPVPSAWRLLRQSLQMRDSRDYVGAALTWGSAGELAIDHLFVLANCAAGQPPPQWHRHTLGQKLREYELAGHALPASLARSEVQRKMVEVRNAAAHGREVMQEDCAIGYSLAEQLVAAAWALPAA